MKSERINEIGQRVVEVELGCKIYDDEDKNVVVTMIGDYDPDGRYVYLDKDAFENGNDEVCFMDSVMLKSYEKTWKEISAIRGEEWKDIRSRLSRLDRISGIHAFEAKRKYGSWKAFVSALKSMNLLSKKFKK